MGSPFVTVIEALEWLHIHRTVIFNLGYDEFLSSLYR